MTVLVIAATVVVLTSILRPMRQLHETMGVITDSPSDLSFDLRLRVMMRLVLCLTLTA